MKKINYKFISKLIDYESEIALNINNVLSEILKTEKISSNVEDFDEIEIKILSFLYSVYYSEVTTEYRTYYSFYDIKTEIFGEQFSEEIRKHDFSSLCKKLYSLKMVESVDSKYYISEYGLLYIMARQNDKEWTEDLLKNSVLSHLQIKIKNIIDRIINGEIRKNING
jgi:hypothetical protein